MARRDRIPWLRRTGPGRYALDLPDDARGLVGDLVDQLRTLLTDTTDDPNVRRLFPTAYHEDPERDREYQQLVRDELLTRRLAALDEVTATLRARELDEAQLSAWMGGVNDLRLVLGTALDISEEDDRPDPGHPDAPTYAVYAFLTEVLDGIVDALADGLGDAPSPI
jgi:hypothetical protein